jgi:hypothetical protein
MVSGAYNCQIKKSKIKLFTEYENSTQKVLLLTETILQIAKKTSTLLAFLGT